MNDRYTDGRYLALNSSWHEEDANWKADQVVKAIRSCGLPTRSMCDIGCGTGGVISSLSLKLSGCDHFVGVDPSGEAIRLGQRHATSVELRQSEASQIGEHFDVALALDVLEHVPDYFGFLSAIRPVADSFVFHIPLDLNAQMAARNLPALMRETIGHLHYFSKDTALATLGDAGYEVIEWFYTAAGLEAPSLTFRAKLARLPRSLLFRIAPDTAVRTVGGFALMVVARPVPRPGPASG